MDIHFLEHDDVSTRWCPTRFVIKRHLPGLRAPCHVIACIYIIFKTKPSHSESDLIEDNKASLAFQFKPRVKWGYSRSKFKFLCLFAGRVLFLYLFATQIFYLFSLASTSAWLLLTFFYKILITQPACSGFYIIYVWRIRILFWCHFISCSL